MNTGLVAAKDIFTLPTPRIFTIPPATSFLDSLARTLSETLNLQDDPAALADAVIFCPNKRSSRAIAQAFHVLATEKYGHKALIAPEIRVLGDLEDDHTIAPIGVSELELGPPLSPSKRRGALANLVQKFRAEDPLPPSSALTVADQLGSLLDQAAMGEGVDWSKLETLVDDADLAKHWQLSAKFLEIVGEYWPAHLDEEGATDPMARRVAAAQALANNWHNKPPKHPIIIAGSTGATPATRLLMQAAMNLPQGAVVLPGLDPDVSEDAWSAIASSPSHPQHTLQRALGKLGVDKSHVIKWPGAVETPNNEARRKLINEALAPASTTKDWTDRLKVLSGAESPKHLVESGLKGLTLIEAEDESEEALAAALLLREALETKGKTAALVSPDGSLVRRVSALLTRWGVEIDPSSGTPFLQTPHGALFALMFQWLRDEGDPVQMLSLLKHPLVRIGWDEENYQSALIELEAHADEFGKDSIMRGPRRHDSLEELADKLGMNKRAQSAQLIRDLVSATRQCEIRPSTMQKPIDGNSFARSIARLAERLVTTPAETGSTRLWRGSVGAEAARYLEALAEISQELGEVAPDLWGEFAEAIASERAIPPRGGEHPRLAIWGPLEARQQMRDVIVLASLNEGAWPAAAAADSFLPRRLRKKLGLPDPEERLGLSAHDFAQLACAPDVKLLRSKRVDDKPAVASRWLWRLRTLSAGGLGSPEAVDEALHPTPQNDPLVWARAMRKARTYAPAQPPAPKPPIDARPTVFSVSRVATLIRDPYAVYASDVLKLKPLAPVGADSGPAGRGTAIHAAVERYEIEGGDIMRLINEELKAAGETTTAIELNRPLWSRAADAYLVWRNEREPRVREKKLEIKGSITFEVSGRKYILHAKADRIDLLKDNTFAIIDFKTGTPKTKKQLETGLEPQLPLEALIAHGGGFEKLPAADTSELIYVSLAPGAASTKADNGKPVKLDEGPMAEAQKARDGFLRLIHSYSTLSQAYYSKPRAEFTWAVSDYDRLARRDEWTLDAGADA
ncbi:double-strand break repair protein AddB [Hirschia litorea]|uniref:Double-strand break repair protein AddB n=1 Tax=Hirschia litorea TaxID=1199156 RepID=A0ABW2IKR4_9PROT